MSGEFLFVRDNGSISAKRFSILPCTQFNLRCYSHPLKWFELKSSRIFAYLFVAFFCVVVRMLSVDRDGRTPSKYDYYLMKSGALILVWFEFGIHFMEMCYIKWKKRNWCWKFEYAKPFQHVWWKICMQKE